MNIGTDSSERCDKLSSRLRSRSQKKVLVPRKFFDFTYLLRDNQYVQSFLVDSNCNVTQ